MSSRPSPSGLQKDGAPVADWPTIRNWVLKRDEYVCQTCKVNTAGEVDHIWPRRLGGADHIDNLRAICGPCNKAKGARVDLATASNQQLRLARNALRGRIETIEVEYHDVINEEMRRCLASDGMALSVLHDVKADIRKRAKVIEEWVQLHDIVSPPWRQDSVIRSLDLAIERLVGAGDPRQAALALNDLDALRVLRAYRKLRELANAILPADAWASAATRQPEQPIGSNIADTP